MADQLTHVAYKVREIKRYVVTRFHSGESEGGGNFGGCEERGEYDNANIAFEVGYALCKAEHDRLGWPIADERIQYPRHPKEENAVPLTV